MAQDILDASRLSSFFSNYCKSKGYQVDPKTNENGDTRLEISNLKERVILTIYHTGSIVTGGKKSVLRAEFEKLKQQITDDPQSLIGSSPHKLKACSTKYDIVLPEIMEQIKDRLSTFDSNFEIVQKESSPIYYVAKLIKLNSAITITQYHTGTLLLQGKEDALFNECCDFIEKVADPDEHDVVIRFLSSDEKSLEDFTARFTPKLLELAEFSAREKVGVGLEYLELHDRKWFIASECLRIVEIPLPEFSPLVMPASKAFEGFAKKILVDIGLYEPDHFKAKDSTFAHINDTKHPKRVSVCQKEKYVDTYLKRISLDLDMFRNFMMHSDGSAVTKVQSREEAIRLIDRIMVETKEIFEYFNDVFDILKSKGK
jgi:hypothetical protein